MDEGLRSRAIMLGLAFVTLAIVALTIASFYKRTARTRTLIVPFDIAACDDDQDCGLTNQIGCCSCEIGGGQGAVNPAMREHLKGFLQRACRGRVICVTVNTCRTDLVPHCRDGQCVLEGQSS